VSEQVTVSPQAPAVPGPAKRKYPALRVIAAVYRVLAFVMLFAAAIGVIVGLVLVIRPSLVNHTQYGLNPGIGIGLMVVLSSIVSGVFGFVALMAASDSMRVFIDLEANTRAGNDLLTAILERQNNR
jgi:hypothetical protein